MDEKDEGRRTRMKRTNEEEERGGVNKSDDRRTSKSK